jgi:predicted acetyltransferase
MDSESPTIFGELRDPGILRDAELLLRLDRIAAANADRGHSPAYHFGLFREGTEKEIGQFVLRVGWTKNIILYGGHVGYTINPEERGHSYAPRAVRLLLPIAWGHGLPEVWITCNPDNIASIRTCERLGAIFRGNVPLPINTDMYVRGERSKNRYSIARPQKV